MIHLIDQDGFAIGAYLRQMGRRKGRFSIHSPYVYRLYTQAILGKGIRVDTHAIEELRQVVRKRRDWIPIEDHGAGHHNKGGGPRQVRLGQLLRQSAASPRQGALLARLTHWLQPQRMLELGTHLGFSAMYQLIGVPQAQLITLEGAGSLAFLAQQHLNTLKMEADIRFGPFEESLPQVDLAAYQPDYVYLDGDHRYEATLAYVEAIAPHMSANSVMVLDDIYWSRGMQQAWQEICQRPEISVSMDLGNIGLTLWHRQQAKEHFVLWG